MNRGKLFVLAWLSLILSNQSFSNQCAVRLIRQVGDRSSYVNDVTAFIEHHRSHASMSYLQRLDDPNALLILLNSWDGKTGIWAPKQLRSPAATELSRTLRAKEFACWAGNKLCAVANYSLAPALTLLGVFLIENYGSPRVSPHFSTIFPAMVSVIAGGMGTAYSIVFRYASPGLDAPRPFWFVFKLPVNGVWDANTFSPSSYNYANGTSAHFLIWNRKDLEMLDPLLSVGFGEAKRRKQPVVQALSIDPAVNILKGGFRELSREQFLDTLSNAPTAPVASALTDRPCGGSTPTPLGFAKVGLAVVLGATVARGCIPIAAPEPVTNQVVREMVKEIEVVKVITPPDVVPEDLFEQWEFTYSTLAKRLGASVPEGRVAEFLAAETIRRLEKLKVSDPAHHHAYENLKRVADKARLVANTEHDLSNPTQQSLQQLNDTLAAIAPILKSALLAEHCQEDALVLLAIQFEIERRSAN